MRLVRQRRADVCLGAWEGAGLARPARGISDPMREATRKKRSWGGRRKENHQTDCLFLPNSSLPSTTHLPPDRIGQEKGGQGKEEEEEIGGRSTLLPPLIADLLLSNSLLPSTTQPPPDRSRGLRGTSRRTRSKERKGEEVAGRLVETPDPPLLSNDDANLLYFLVFNLKKRSCGSSPTTPCWSSPAWLRWSSSSLLLSFAHNIYNPGDNSESLFSYCSFLNFCSEYSAACNLNLS